MTEEGKLRKYPRVQKLLFTEVTSYDTEGEGSVSSLGRTLNISQGGMLVEIGKGIPFQLKVSLNLGFKDDIVKLDGDVVHLKKTDDGSVEIGLEFTSLSEEQEEFIRSQI